LLALVSNALHLLMNSRIHSPRHILRGNTNVHLGLDWLGWISTTGASSAETGSCNTLTALEPGQSLPTAAERAQSANHVRQTLIGPQLIALTNPLILSATYIIFVAKFSHGLVIRSPLDTSVRGETSTTDLCVGYLLLGCIDEPQGRMLSCTWSPRCQEVKLRSNPSRSLSRIFLCLPRVPSITDWLLYHQR